MQSRQPLPVDREELPIDPHLPREDPARADIDDILTIGKNAESVIAPRRCLGLRGCQYFVQIEFKRIDRSADANVDRLNPAQPAVGNCRQIERYAASHNAQRIAT